VTSVLTGGFPDHARALFGAKGPENAARVRRMIRTVSALHREPKDWSRLRVLDLGCGEGLFALEAAAHGASVLAIDGRDQRMARGRALAEELGLTRLRFVKADVCSFAFEEQGPFDVVLCLGLLYHLDREELVSTLRRIAAATDQTLLLETHVAPHAQESMGADGQRYRGFTYREHEPDDAPPTREARMLASLSNESAFWPTRSSLIDLLGDVGFDVVLECELPRQPFQAEERVTLAALKGQAPPVLSFPWIESATEAEVRSRAGSATQVLPLPPCGDLRSDTVTDVIVTLGSHAKLCPEFVVGTRGVVASSDALEGTSDAALWRRKDLARYTGRLRRVPPLLAVEVQGAEDDLEDLDRKARWLLEAGVPRVWIVRPANMEVIQHCDAGVQRYRVGETIPARPDVPGFTPAVADLLNSSLIPTR
jgi:SAM-dependent methyltransferase